MRKAIDKLICLLQACNGSDNTCETDTSTTSEHEPTYAKMYRANAPYAAIG